jgi:predicted secreted Zn-dependent protease
MITKLEVTTELMNMGFGKDNAENLIEKHIEYYEVNCDDEDSSPRDIALSIEEAEMQDE